MQYLELENIVKGLKELKEFREEVIKDFNSDYVINLEPINADAYLSVWNHEHRVNCKECKVVLKMNNKEFSSTFNIDTKHMGDMQYLHEEIKQQIVSILLEHLAILIKPLISMEESEE